MRYVIGVDLGTGGVKTLLLSEVGRICADTTIGYSPDYPRAGYSEQDPAVWWSAVKGALYELIGKYPKAKGNIAALSCSGQMHSSVFLDKDGKAIRKAILWNDARTNAQTAYLKQTIGTPRLLECVQNLALEGFTLPKLLWLRDNEPNNYARLDKLIMPKDYINYCLTGVICTERSDAAGTLMYDVKNDRWSDEILSALNIDKCILPRVLISDEPVGTVKGELCEILGNSCLVIAGGADNSCAALGNGMSKVGEGVISIGTSGTVIGCMNELNKEATGEVHLFSYCVPSMIYAMGCMLSAGESLNWLKRTLFEQILFKELDSLAEKSPVGSNGVIFLPYLFGERTPHNDTNARGIYFGLSAATCKGDIIRSTLEGVAFGIRDMYERVCTYTSLEKITLTGGGAKSPLWAQIIADVINKPLIISSVSEGPSMGAALLAFKGSGIGAVDIPKSISIIEPSKQRNMYDAYYELYKELYIANKTAFAELARLRQ